MRIPLPKLMRHYREKAHEEKLTPAAERAGLGLWAFAARRPGLYRWAAGLVIRVLGALGRRRGRFASLPFASGWTRYRDLPAPQGQTFQQQWAARNGRRGRGA